MKPELLLLLGLMTVSIPLSTNAEDRIAKSKIDKVTVFSDRAQVTRICTENLPAGDFNVIFDNLPQSVDKSSLMVDGSGNGTVRDVKFTQTPTIGNTDSLSSYLNDKKQQFTDSLAIIDDHVKRIQSEKQFIDNIATKVTEKSTSTTVSTLPELDNNKWQKMVDFYRTRTESLDKELRVTAKTRRLFNDSLVFVTTRLANIGRDAQAIHNQAVINVVMKEPGKITLNLSYITYGPSWSPAYELRVLTQSDKKVLKIAYRGQLRQSTGEDWTDAIISMSTAQPQVAGSQPELSPWYVNFYQAPAYYARSAPPAASMNKFSSNALVAEQMYEMDKMEDASAPPPPIAVASASVQTGATSALFVINGRSTVTSDNEIHALTIMTKEFPAQFRYSTIPKLSQFAYLKAKVKNESDYPLLPGPTSIFLDNSFIANGNLNLVAPQEEFWTSLGVDQAFKVEYKLINRLERKDGVLTKHSKIVYEYEIVLTNNRKTQEEITVWDQLPISGNKDIKIEVIDPKIKENSETVKKNEYNYYEWNYKLKPGEKSKIPFKFSVEYPEGKSIIGL